MDWKKILAAHGQTRLADAWDKMSDAARAKLENSLRRSISTIWTG